MAPSPRADPAQHPVAAATFAWAKARPTGERVTVAASGGVDSTVLLHALVTARERLRPDLDLRAHHVHHGLLPEAMTWQHQVEALCARLGVALTTDRVTVDLGSGQGLEAAARSARYASFARLDTDCLVLAHQADDQVETILLQLLRGGGPRALAGMPLRRMLGRTAIERPLLGLSRALIADYARQQGLPSVSDPSNADPRFARARLRRLWPALCAAFPDAARHIASAARQQAEASQLLDQLAESDLSTCMTASGLDLAAWLRLAPPRRRNALRHWLRQAGIATPTRHQIEEVARQLACRPNGLQVSMRAAGGAGMLQLRTYRGQASVSSPIPLTPTVSLPGELRTPGTWPTARGVLRVFEAAPDRGAGSAAALVPPTVMGRTHWCVRMRQPGDRIRLNARSGEVTLKHLFQTQGIAPWDRPHWPVVCDADRVIAVAGLAVDDRYRADSGLILEWKPVSSPERVTALSPVTGSPGQPPDR